MDTFLIPIHLGFHWCLSVVRPKQGSIGYFDSGGGSNDERLEVCFIIFKENTWPLATQRSSDVEVIEPFFLEWSYYRRSRRAFGWSTNDVEYLPRYTDGSPQTWRALLSKSMGTTAEYLFVCSPELFVKERRACLMQTRLRFDIGWFWRFSGVLFKLCLFAILIQRYHLLRLSQKFVLHRGLILCS